MRYQIVSDSSSNVFHVEGLSYTTVPMKIIAGEKEYVDCETLDVRGMVDDLRAYKGKSGSSCANAQEWLDAFGDADMVFGVTISRNLSGSFNAAEAAAREFAEEHPNAKIHIFDSLSAGPEMAMVTEKIVELVNQGLSFEEIVAGVREYQNHCHTLFCLECMNNLARNGRVNPAVAKIATVLGINIVGKASDVGTLEPLHKCRGEKSALKTLYKTMKELGFTGGKVRISHCLNPNAADMVVGMIRADFPDADVVVDCAKGLVCYYAEKGGMLIGFEG